MESIKDFFKPEVIWFVIGIILLVAEFSAPGLVIFFFGVGAIIVALVCLLFDPSLNLQLIIFIVSSVVLLIGLRKWLKTIFIGRAKGGKEMDDLQDDFVGHRAVVKKKIIPGIQGEVEFNGTLWKADAESEIKEGSIVEIITKDNITLKVKSIK